MSRTEPVPPSNDWWYKAPPQFEQAPPGAVLRVRAAPGSLRDMFTKSATIYNILFRTTDSHYRPSWGVTTLFLPEQSDGKSLLSHQIPYNSADVDSSPSHLLHRVTSTFWESMIEVVDFGMNHGWCVQIPDHEGPQAAHGNGITSGHTVLDAVRAILNVGFVMDKSKARVCFTGYSGGALAAGWAAQLQPHYAPELPCTGAALGGLAPDMRDVARLSGTVYSGIIPQLLLGVVAEYPEARDYLISQLKPAYKDAFLATYHYDIVTAFGIFMNQDMLAYFEDGAAVLRHPLIFDLLVRNGTLGHHGVPKMPLFIYKAIADEIAPIEQVDSLVEKWAYAGANILYERNTVGDHMSEASNSKSRAFQFLVDVIDGTYSHRGCTIRDVTFGPIA